MTPFWRNVLILGALIVVGLALFGHRAWSQELVMPPMDHRSGAHWYDYQCCSEHDCRPTVLKEVERTDEGWLVRWTPGSPRPLFEPRLFPFSEARFSRDELVHICVRAGKVICIYVPDPGI